jgi:hypothetical protein
VAVSVRCSSRLIAGCVLFVVSVSVRFLSFTSGGLFVGCRLASLFVSVWVRWTDCPVGGLFDLVFVSVRCRSRFADRRWWSVRGVRLGSLPQFHEWWCRRSRFRSRSGFGGTDCPVGGLFDLVFGLLRCSSRLIAGGVLFVVFVSVSCSVRCRWWSQSRSRSSVLVCVWWTDCPVDVSALLVALSCWLTPLSVAAPSAPIIKIPRDRLHSQPPLSQDFLKHIPDDRGVSAGSRKPCKKGRV